MNPLVVFSVILATASAGTILGAAPYAGLPLAAGVAPYAGLPLTTTYPLGKPIAAAAGYATPVVAAPAPIVPHVSSQYQSQDELGNLNFGYSNINSARHESGNTFAGVSGGYSYVDANGITQQVHYVADALGYRVAATNLPQAPVADLEAPVFNLVGPAPVQDTPEVAAAKEEFLKVFNEEKSRVTKRSTPAATTPLAYAGIHHVAPLATAYNGLGYAGLGYTGLGYAGLGYAGLPYAPAYAAGYAAPLHTAYAGVAPLATAAVAPYATALPASGRPATLTEVKLNPGHAVSYRVD